MIVMHIIWPFETARGEHRTIMGTVKEVEHFTYNTNESIVWMYCFLFVCFLNKSYLFRHLFSPPTHVTMWCWTGHWLKESFLVTYSRSRHYDYISCIIVMFKSMF